MPCRNAISALLVIVALCAIDFGATCVAAANDSKKDDSKYPDWSGQWLRTYTGPPRYDQSKPVGAGQEAPLIPEYQTLLDISIADQDAGGQGADPTYLCISPGMPRVMNNSEGAEIVVTPAATYILLEHIHDSRRIFTDGRDWPAEIEPSYAGYSIGRWIDEGGTGRYNLLEVETRGFKGPRAYDHTGIPLHQDNQSVIKERFYRDKADPNFLYDEITTIDHALTRPWSVTKKYRHNPSPQPVWRESICAENNPHLEIAKQGYMLSADGLLMPTRKGQPPPDLSFFKPMQK